MNERIYILEMTRERKIRKLQAHGVDVKHKRLKILENIETNS